MMVETTDPWFHIANSMMRERTPARGESVIHAGLTYIGQMISHDIVAPTNQKIIDGKEVDSRLVTTALNLDSIYGNADAALFKSNPIQTGYLDADGLFEFDIIESGDKDLKRQDGKLAQIPEPRNDENRIISQLHLFWQRLHNTLSTLEIDGQPIVENALQTRELVTKLFQLVTIEDFLQKTVSKVVFEQYFRANNTN